MKHLLVFICCLSLLCGCGAVDVPAETAAPVATASPTPTPTCSPAPAPTPTPTAEPLKVWPGNVGMAYYSMAAALPEHIYHTLGSENGLEGTICTFEGAVSELRVLENVGGGMEYAIVETDQGSVLVMDLFSSVYRETAAQFSPELAESMYADDPSWYGFPPAGERACFVAVYSGYSRAEEMPAFYLGASPDIYSILELPDPVSGNG